MAVIDLLITAVIEGLTAMKWNPWSMKEDQLRWELEQAKAKAALKPPPDAPYDREAAMRQELAEAREASHKWRTKYQDMQSALRSVVLRLKVLDIDQLAKEQGEDGSVPLRLAISELRDLVAAYDGKMDPMDQILRYTPEQGTTTATHITQPSYSTWSSTSTTTTTSPGMYYKVNQGKP